jgi:hypothetical protein
VAGAIEYRIEIGHDQGFSSLEVAAAPSGTAWTPGANLPLGEYYWRVRAKTPGGDGPWSVVRQLLVQAIPVAPALSSPADGEQICNPAPTLYWQASPFADLYRIEIDDAPDFASPLNQNSSQSTETSPTPKAPGQYWWRVKGGNACGEGDWSAARSFTILPMPAAPTLLSPLNGATVASQQPTLTWSAVTGANVYDVEIDDDPGFGSPQLMSRTDTSLVPPQPLPLGTNHWRVRAVAIPCPSEWSAPWSFRVGVHQVFLPVVMKGHR